MTVANINLIEMNKLYFYGKERKKYPDTYFSSLTHLHRPFVLIQIRRTNSRFLLKFNLRTFGFNAQKS